MSTMQKVMKLREDIAASKVKRDAAAIAPLSRAELTAAMSRQLEIAGAVAERAMAHRVGAADYDDGLLAARVTGDGRVDLLPPMVALFGAEAVQAMLARFVERAPDGPSVADRAARLSALEAELTELEVAEEKAIRALESQGVEVIRRGDADPRAVLAGL